LSAVKENIIQKQSIIPPILVLTDLCFENRQWLYDQGIHDYMITPIIEAELLLRVRLAMCSHKEETPIIECKACIKKSKQKQTLNQNLAIDPAFTLAEKAAAFLLSEMANDISISTLIRQMGTNRNKLSFAFKTYYGITPLNWIREQRMLHASQLLTKTNKTILVISHAVGYPDSNNFSTAFKRTYQLSPLQ